MKRVLVTGATGFIGGYVIDELLKGNFEVIATSSSREKAMKAEWFEKVTYLEFDLKNQVSDVDYFSFFKKPHILIHLAWEGLPNYTQPFHLNENLPNHIRFLENIIANGLKDLTITGTCLEYGMKEGALSEEIEADPTNSYAIAKNELRKAIQLLCELNLCNFKWIRLFYMYGKGQSPKSLISQLDHALERNDASFNMSGGEQVRDFLPVRKVAEFIIKIASQSKITGIINCASGKPVKLKDFVAEYLNKKNRQIHLNLGYYKYTDYEPMEFWGENSKLKSILNND